MKTKVEKRHHERPKLSPRRLKHLQPQLQKDLLAYRIGRMQCIRAGSQSVMDDPLI